MANAEAEISRLRTISPRSRWTASGEAPSAGSPPRLRASHASSAWRVTEAITPEDHDRLSDEFVSNVEGEEHDSGSSSLRYVVLVE